jgi:hypothetical protein
MERVLLDKAVAQDYIKKSIYNYVTAEYAAAELDNLPPATGYITYEDGDTIEDVLKRVFPDYEETAILDIIASSLDAGVGMNYGRNWLKQPYIRKEPMSKEKVIKGIDEIIAKHELSEDELNVLSKAIKYIEK